jgi:outer membrane protein assembly factor BamA
MRKSATTALFFLCLFLSTGSILFASNSALFDSELFAKEVSLYSQSEQSAELQQSTKSEPKTRTDTWDAEREAKKDDLHPAKISKFEKYWINSERGGLGWNWHGFAPKFGGFDSGAGIGGGVRYWRRDLFGTPLEFQGQALFSIRGYKIYTLKFGKIMRTDVQRLIGVRGYGGLNNFRGLDKKDYNFFWFGTFRYRDLPEEDFFGLGPDSLEDNRTDFALKDKTFFGTLAYRLTSWAVAGGGAGYMKVENNPGEDNQFPNLETVFDTSTVPGLFQDAHYFFGGASVIIDLRDRPYNPHSGFMFGFERLQYEDTQDTNFSFSKTSYDLRGYIPVFAENRTFALQLYTSMEDPQEGNTIPFYMMETLGGADVLRGFHSYRFRDENLIAISTEYRWEPAQWWELALFYDMGKVFPHGEGWNLNDLEHGYGVGFRLKLEKSVILRFDIGRSNEGNTFFFRISSPSF